MPPEEGQELRDRHWLYTPNSAPRDSGWAFEARIADAIDEKPVETVCSRTRPRLQRHSTT